MAKRHEKLVRVYRDGDRRSIFLPERLVCKQLPQIAPDMGMLIAASRCTGSSNHVVAYFVDRYLEACTKGWEAVAVHMAHCIRMKLVEGLLPRTA